MITTHAFFKSAFINHIKNKLYSMITKTMVDYEIISSICYIEKLYYKIVAKYLF